MCCLLGFFVYSWEFQNSYIGYYESQQLLTTDYAFENKKWIDFIHKYAESCEKAAVTIKTELSEYKNKETLFISINDTQFSFSGKTVYINKWSTCVKDFRNIRHKITSKQFIFDN